VRGYDVIGHCTIVAFEALLAIVSEWLMCMIETNETRSIFFYKRTAVLHR